MWRSEPSISTVVFKRSGSVAMWLFHGLPDHLFEGRHAVPHLPQAALAQRDHPLIDRFPAKLGTGGADENQLAQLFADFHHFVETDAALVARVVALVAAVALHRRDRGGVFGR